MAFQRYVFGARAAMGASYTSPGSYGTAQRFIGVQMTVVGIRTQTAELLGDDVVLDTHAHIIGASLRFRFAFRDLEAFNILTGQSIVSTVNYRRIRFGSDDMPYFGFYGKAHHTSGGGMVGVWVPKVKLTESFDVLTFENGAYTTPELNATGVMDDDIGYALEIHEFVTANTMTIPPTYP